MQIRSSTLNTINDHSGYCSDHSYVTVTFEECCTHVSYNRDINFSKFDQSRLKWNESKHLSLSFHVQRLIFADLAFSAWNGPGMCVFRRQDGVSHAHVHSRTWTFVAHFLLRERERRRFHIMTDGWTDEGKGTKRTIMRARNNKNMKITAICLIASTCDASSNDGCACVCVCAHMCVSQECWSDNGINTKSSTDSFFHLYPGSLRTEGIKASDVLPVLKEKVAFVSGEHCSISYLNHGSNFVTTCS